MFGFHPQLSPQSKCAFQPVMPPDQNNTKTKNRILEESELEFGYWCLPKSALHKAEWQTTSFGVIPKGRATSQSSRIGLVVGRLS